MRAPRHLMSVIARNQFFPALQDAAVPGFRLKSPAWGGRNFRRRPVDAPWAVPVPRPDVQARYWRFGAGGQVKLGPHPSLVDRRVGRSSTTKHSLVSLGFRSSSISRMPLPRRTPRRVPSLASISAARQGDPQPQELARPLGEGHSPATDLHRAHAECTCKPPQPGSCNTVLGSLFLFA